jgi:hypothetical protein
MILTKGFGGGLLTKGYGIAGALGDLVATIIIGPALLAVTDTSGAVTGAIRSIRQIFSTEETCRKVDANTTVTPGLDQTTMASGSIIGSPEQRQSVAGTTFADNVLGANTATADSTQGTIEEETSAQGTVKTRSSVW